MWSILGGLGIYEKNVLVGGGGMPFTDKYTNGRKNKSCQLLIGYAK